MNIFICRFCRGQKKSKKSLIGHETFCKLNPNHKIQNTETARRKALQKIKCRYCSTEYTKGNIAKHEKSCIENPANIKNCPVCSKVFSGKSTTCSYSCSNVYFRHSNIGGLQYKTDKDLNKAGRYRELCFRYHDKKCVVCSEKNIVAVHHFNENHSDNRPENLIPLCPTHHQYLHSEYKYLVDNIVEQYIIQWKQKLLSVG